jgi:S-adenosylmethionine synthetase
MVERKILSSESVTEGHPDKICDQISDAVLDALIKQDPYSRVAVETAVKDNWGAVFGEVTSKGSVDYEKIARRVLFDIGYFDSEIGIDYNSAQIDVRINKQSPDIARGVDETENKLQGAGDQGMMYGFACNETPELMPLPIALAHGLTKQLTNLRKSLEYYRIYFRPDGKSQVSIEYQKDKPSRIEAIVIAQQHSEDISEKKLRKEILDEAIIPVCRNYGFELDKETKIHINSTGRFIIGGPKGDSGLTGRKIIVDTYGGIGRHGGGAFSGKDPTKVDRSGAYMARYVAKNIVASGLADKCEVALSYAIGVAEPTSVYIDCFGTENISSDKISKLVRENFDLTPAGIIKTLDLRRPIYRQTASYGHFGRNDLDLPWEKTDKAELLRKSAGRIGYAGAIKRGLKKYYNQL